MSGVFAAVTPQFQKPALDVGQAMLAAMRHLPHQQGDYGAFADGVTLGRIHIGRMNRAPQPVQQGPITLCLTGEFYVQHERRAMLMREGRLAADADDAALALAVYQRDGAAGLAELNGAFTVVVWDAHRHELVVVNDRFGLYPHYYAHTGGIFALAPELKGVLAAGIPRQLDTTALAQYVRFQQFLGQRTWLADVHVLPPATILRYRPERQHLSLQTYWDFDQIPQQEIGFDDAVEEAWRLFKRAVATMTQPPLRAGVYLSGGLDGRIILGATDPNIPVSTITFGDPECRDVVYARAIARAAHRPNHTFALSDGRWVLDHWRLHLALTERMHSWMHGHGISTLSGARELVDVHLSGWDGETTLGGIAVLDKHAEDRYYRFAPTETDAMQRLYHAFCQLLTWPGMNEAEASALLSGPSASLRSLAFDSLQQEFGKTAHYPADRRVDYFIIRNLLRRSLQNQIVTARSHIEVRCPYFDYDLVTFMYSLPDAVRANPNFRRALLARKMPKLALIPYEKDDRLPHENALVRTAHATGLRGVRWIGRRAGLIPPDRTRLYADYEHYLRTDLREWAAQILFSPAARERNLFDQATVRALWERHQRGDELWTIGKIAPLITIELVLQTMFDQPATPQQPCDTAGVAAFR